MKRTVLLVILLLFIPCLVWAQEAMRTWKSKSGKTVIEAVWDNQDDSEPETVFLLKDGKRYKYPFEKLSDADQKFVADGRAKRAQRGTESDPDLILADETPKPLTFGGFRLPTAKKYAVLIGVTDYVTMNDLKYTVRDVEAIRDQLLKIGFLRENVQMLTTGSDLANQPTQRNIQRAVKSTLDQAQAGDLVFFAFSGHGAQVGDEVFFCPQDTVDDDISSTAVSITNVMADLSKSKADFKWLVIDACRNNPFRQRVAGVRSIQKIDVPPKGIALFQSCAQDEYSYEDESVEHGLFTSNFVKGMQGAADSNNDGVLTFLEVCTYTTSRTVSEVQQKFRANQRPYLSGNISDFVLMEDLNRPKADALFAEAQKLFTEEDYETAKTKIAEAMEMYPKEQKYAHLGGTIDRFLKIQQENERLAREKAEAERKAKEVAELAQRQNAPASSGFGDVPIPAERQNVPAPSGSGDVSIPAGRRVNISTSSQLHDALENENNAVLMLAAGTYNLSGYYLITDKDLSIYGNPTDPSSVKIRFDKFWYFDEGSRGSIIGVDIVGEYGVRIENSGTSMTLRNCVLHDCEMDGIRLTSGARADVRDCEIRNCKVRGIAVYESDTALQAENCRISGNGSHGISVNGGRADVSNCEIRDNEKRGVFCFSGAMGSFRGNHLSGNRTNWDIKASSGIITRMGNTPND